MKFPVLAAIAGAWLLLRGKRAEASGSPGAGDASSSAAVEAAARSAAASEGIPAWLVLATAEVEGSMRHGPPYMDSNGQRSFRPYGFQAQSAATVRGGQTLTRWLAGGAEREAVRADLEAELSGLAIVTRDAAALLRIYWSRYGDADLVRVAWLAGGSVANAARDSGRHPAFYTDAKRRRWHEAIARWGGDAIS